MKTNPEKRKAIYIIKDYGGELVWVEQKRPKIKDHDEYRPFWDKFEDAEVAMDRIAASLRVTLYRIKDNKIESFRVRSISQNRNSFTSRDQAQERLEEITKSFDYTITRGNISIFYDGKTYNITASDKRFPRFHRACVDDDLFAILDLLDLKNKIKKSVKIFGTNMEISGHKVPSGLAKKLVDSTIIYNDAKVINNFKKRLDKNTSKSAQRNLLEFLSYHGACILEDGRFLAYKYLNSNFYDMHTGKYDYSPGKTVTMPRNKVVEDPRIACAAGLHVGSWSYSGSHSTVVVCVIDPVDVVSVPDDYSYQKMRCCRVTSIKRIHDPIKDTTLPVSYLNESADAA